MWSKRMGSRAIQRVVGFLLARTSHRGIEPRCDFLMVIPYTGSMKMPLTLRRACLRSCCWGNAKAWPLPRWRRLPPLTSSVGVRSRTWRVFLAFFSFILCFFLVVLAFRELSSWETHFWPSTEVMRKGRREVTRKVASGLRWKQVTWLNATSTAISKSG